MSLSTKILLILAAFLTLGAASFIIYKQIEISNRQSAIETQIINQKQLTDNITRSLNQYTTKDDIEKFIKENNINLKVIQEDLSKLNASILAINTTNIHSNGSKGSNIPSTSTGPANPNPQTNPTDQYGYLKTQQNFKLNEKFANVTVPIAEVGFSAWKKEPWTENILPRTYKSSSVIAIDENQRHIIYNKFSIEVDGKSYDITLDKAETKEVYPEAKFSLWNPRFFMNGNFLANLSNMQPEISPGLSVGFMSYGRYLNTPDFSLLHIGVSYGLQSNKPSFNFAPINYNIGKLLPGNLVSNTYVGPSMQVNTSGNVMIGAGFSIGF